MANFTEVSKEDLTMPKCELCGLFLEMKGSRQFCKEGGYYHDKCYKIICQKKEKDFSRKKRGLQLYLS